MFLLRKLCLEICDSPPLEAEESTEAAATSHLYPLHPVGHLDTVSQSYWECVCVDVCEFEPQKKRDRR